MNISSYSFYTPFGGWGIFNLGWTKYLTRHGVHISISPQFSPKAGSDEWNILSNEEKKLFTEFKQERIGISATTPSEFKFNTSEIRVGYTMAESDHIGEEWVKACNGMNYIVVPNFFYKDVFIDSGVAVPIKVIPPGIDVEKFPYFDRPERKTYTFGICGHLNDRKGVFDLLRAFTSEFESEEPVQLHLHTTKADFRYYSHFTDSRITTTWDQKDFTQLNEFYRNLDCFVFPSKAEGVGYPPREAMSTGLPVILTEWSGLSDIAQSGHSYPLSVKNKTSKDLQDQPGNWAEIDIQELMYWMRWVYEHRKESKRKGRYASELIHKFHNWDYCGKKLYSFLEGI